MYVLEVTIFCAYKGINWGDPTLVPRTVASDRVTLIKDLKNTVYNNLRTRDGLDGVRPDNPITLEDFKSSGWESKELDAGNAEDFLHWLEDSQYLVSINEVNVLN